MIYLIYKPNAWITIILSKLSIQLNHYPINDGFTRFICNYGCDMLWAYAMVHFVSLGVFFKPNDWEKVLFQCLLMDIAGECIQLIPEIGGTFDVLDIVLEIIVSVAAVVLSYLKVIKTENIRR
ncbi:MAG: hypothetical protein Q4E45_01525 [Eubacteriales bacterium]|nr:hypothetical protein [Eubacteriales bacterium]